MNWPKNTEELITYFAYHDINMLPDNAIIWAVKNDKDLLKTFMILGYPEERVKKIMDKMFTEEIGMSVIFGLDLPVIHHNDSFEYYMSEE